MGWVTVGLLVLGLYWLWEIRRTLGVRARTRLVRRLTPTSLRREGFKGAIPPARYCVVRWPDGLHLYNGCYGAQAREAFDRNNPEAGEEIELWELDNCRGVK
jgi:hypothetical protein